MPEGVYFTPVCILARQPSSDMWGSFEGRTSRSTSAFSKRRVTVSAQRQMRSPCAEATSVSLCIQFSCACQGNVQIVAPDQPFPTVEGLVAAMQHRRSVAETLVR